MIPALQEVLVDLGIADADLRDRLHELLDRFRIRYNTAGIFIATQSRGQFEVVISDTESDLERVAVRGLNEVVQDSTLIEADALDLQAGLGDCHMRILPMRLSNGFVYASLCGLFREQDKLEDASRLQMAAEAVNRVLMIHNLRLRYGTASFGKHAFWNEAVIPDLRLAAATGRGYGLVQFTVVPPVEYPPYWLRPEWIYTIANLGFWVRRHDWPEVTRIARFRIDSFAVGSVGLDEAGGHEAARAVSSNLGALLPASAAGEPQESGCSLEVRGLFFPDARELIERGQPQLLRDLGAAPSLLPGE